MKEISGIYASAKIFTDNIEEYAVAQIQMLCDHEVSKNSKIRVMPDVHPGKVGTIGLTMTVGARIIPYLLGGDIGCGITCYKIRGKRVDGKQLDGVIRKRVPAGHELRKKEHHCSDEFPFRELGCFSHINEEKARASLGTLGGGNHFLEVDSDEEGALYLTVHSGSRHLGLEVTEYYQKLAYEHCREKGLAHPVSYLEGDLMEAYLQDVKTVQKFASLNRRCMLDEICKGMKWKVLEEIETVHNYVDSQENGVRLLRKGAVSANVGEQLLIPVNMKEGMLLCIGKGNEEWNNSAPHGSGRICRRDQVKKSYTVSAFKKEMQGIYCSCIGKETLDEAPFAYRSMREIREAVKDTAEVKKLIRPVYNFKAGRK